MSTVPPEFIELAIDEVMREPANHDFEGVVEIHGDHCTGDACICTPRHLLVPPAQVADVYWWMRHVDTSIQHPGRAPFT